MNWQVAWEATQGVLDIGHCSAVKVFGTELNLEGYQLLMEILGPVSYLEPDAPGAVLQLAPRAGHRGSIILTFGGGVNEMQRDLISMFALGFPRATGDGLLLHLRPGGPPRARRPRSSPTPPRSSASSACSPTSTASTASCGRRSPRPASSASRCPSRSVAAGSASSRRASCSRRSAAPRRPSRARGHGSRRARAGASSVPPTRSTGVADGTRIVTAALTRRSATRRTPSTSRRPAASSPARRCACPPGSTPSAIVVSASDGLYLVDPSAPGVTVEREDTSAARRWPGSCCGGAEATKLAGPGGPRLAARAGARPR